MWVHEGFTCYSENLYVDYFFGKKASAEYVIGTRRGISNKKPIIGQYDVNREGSGDMYSKGANLLHTIRQLAKDDEVWRQTLRGLNKEFYHSTVTTKEIEEYISKSIGMDLSKIFDLRKKYKEAFSQKHGVSLGFMSFFTKAVTRALELYPDVNSMIDGNEKISYNYSDISIAVSGPKGLMTPVLRNAQDLSFAAVEQEIKRLADNVRNKSITVDDLTGGTFTISNGGVFGSMLSTPIINPPQSGILGMHNIIQRPIAVDGKVEIRPMMYLALSYDHRIIDGNQSVGFLIAVKEGVEDPENILMDGKVEKSLGLN